MEDELEHIRENEGVVHTVVSEAMGYPCSPFIPDYELLDDASQWEDIEAARAKRTVSTEGLFRIRSTETDDQLSFYLAHLIATREYSDRGVYISSVAIKRNPADYSAWVYRMDCAERLQLSLASELDFARKMAFESPKSYQAWQYRRWLCEQHQDPHNEVEYIKLEIASSPKNHCAWSLLTWLMTAFDVTKEQAHRELEFLDFLLGSDVYNNTAWVYKTFLLSHFRHMFDDDAIVQGYITDLGKMLASPWNQSLSQYLINAVTKLPESCKGCLRLESCAPTCTGGPTVCSIGAIDACGEVTTPLLLLKRAILSDAEELKRVNFALKISDPLRISTQT